MAFNFPSSPSLNDTYTYLGRSWQWNGEGWQVVSIDPTSVTLSDQGEVRLSEATANGTNYVALKGPSSVTSNVTLTLPSADGTNGQVLTTNGSGTLSFQSINQNYLQSTKVVSSNTTVPTAGYNQAALYSLEIGSGVTFEISAGEKFAIID